jgi:hypothetical protein
MSAGLLPVNASKPVEPVYVMKLDTQGNELPALKGATALMSSQLAPEIVNLEFWPAGMQRGDNDPVDVLNFMAKRGYTCFDWSKNRHVPLSRPSDFKGFAGSFFDRNNSPTCSGKECWEFGLWDEIACTRL